MGMNYYVVEKNTNRFLTKLWKSTRLIEDEENNKLRENIDGLVRKIFKKSLDMVSNDEYDFIADNFDDRLNVAINSFISDLKYDVRYVFDLDERCQVHIGKSSLGWLFNFQTQNTELNGVPIKWHSYEEVMAFLEEYVVNKKQFEIVNECDEKVTYKYLKDLIDKKQKDEYCENVNGYRFSSGDFS